MQDRGGTAAPAAAVTQTPAAVLTCAVTRNVRVGIATAI